MQDELFGACLTRLIRESDEKPSTVIAALGEDPGMAYKWLRDERVPRLDRRAKTGDRPLLTAIGEILNLSPRSLRELEEAQIRSLRQPKQLPSPSAGNPGQALVAFANPSSPRPEASLPSEQTFEPPLLPQSRDECLLLPTVESVQNAVLRLLMNADRSELAGREIVMTAQGFNSLFQVPGSDAEHDRWRIEVQRLLRDGCDIRLYLRLARDPDRTRHVFLDMLDFLGFAGKFLPFYARPGGTLPIPYDLLVVPGQGCLILFDTMGAGDVDSGVLVPAAQPYADMLGNHIRQLFQEAAPFLEQFVDHIDYFTMAQELEERGQDQIRVGTTLTSLTRDAEFFTSLPPEVLAAPANISSDELPLFIERQVQRHDVFLRQLERYRHRDICPKSAITEFASKGTSLSTFPKLPGDHCRRQIQAVIDVLEKYPNYELGLLDEEHETNLLPPTLFLVQGDTMLMEAWQRVGEDVKNTRLRVDEPSLVDAGKRYLDWLWRRLGPTNTNREYVKLWLQSQLSLIPDD